MRFLPLAITAASLLSMTACETTTNCIDPRPEELGLPGRWEWTTAQCGFGGTMTPASSGSTEAVVFDASRVIFYRNNQPVDTAQYTIVNQPFCGGQPQTVNLTFRRGTVQFGFSQSGNQLILDEGICVDACRRTYQRSTTGL